MMQSEAELRQLLPWYVNGTLDVTLQRDIDNLMDRSPLVANEVAWLRHLREKIKNLPNVAEQRSSVAGLDTLLAMVRAEESGKLTSLPSRIRLKVWLASPRKFSIPAGLAAAVMLTQAAIIGALLNDPPAPHLTPLSARTSTADALLQITFKPQTTELQIRSLLAGVQGDIVAGPGALGVYTVRIPDGRGAAALAKLSSDPSAIDSIVLLPRGTPDASR